MSNAAYDTSLTDEYIAAAKRPAEVLHDFRLEEDQQQQQQQASLAKVILGGGSDKSDNNNDNDNSDPSSLSQEPIAFVIKNVLTPAECDQLIEEAEDYGIGGGGKLQYLARSAKRTDKYTNMGLSEKIEERIRGVLESALVIGRETDKDFMGPIHGIHDNWRILRYDTDGGDAFPAHQDQMDSFWNRKPGGRKDFVVSSHTLLLQLSDKNLEGGCTRFYPRGTMRLPKNSWNDPDFRNRQFDYAVDVGLPRGWALVFRQRGLMHAGQPLAATSPCPKYVAQAGILRVLPEGVLQKPSVFRNGLGVTKVVSYDEMRRAAAHQTTTTTV